MVLERDFDVVMNRKKIARIKNKFGLITKIRRKNKHRLFSKKQQEHMVCKNILNRNFSIKKSGQSLFYRYNPTKLWPQKGLPGSI